MTKGRYSYRDEMLGLAEEILSELSEINEKVNHLLSLCEASEEDQSYLSNDFDDGNND